ncbi:uncharacterized protein LOC144864732 [Branchiostoma floridae x Branchiostoma japonicum]
MGDTEVLADVTNTDHDVAMNGDNEIFEDGKVFTQKTSITLKKSNASSSSARSGSLSGDEDKKGMKRVSRSSRTSSTSYEKKKREPARLAPSAFAKFQQADAASSSAPAKKINIKLSRSVRDRASETDTTMSTVKQIQDSSDKCKTCGKRVYPVEKLVADKNVYHNTCFKCAECNRTLRVGTYASIDGAIYCKPHFQQLFKLKGNYDEGFGKERAVKKWPASQGDLPQDGHAKAEEPAKKQRRGRDGDADESDDDKEEQETPSSDKSADDDNKEEKMTSAAPVTNKTATAKEKSEGKSSSPEISAGDDNKEEKKTSAEPVTNKTATTKGKTEEMSFSPENSDDDKEEKKTSAEPVTNKTATTKGKTEEMSFSPENSDNDDDDDEDDGKKVQATLVTNKTAPLKEKADGKSPTPEHSDDDGSEDEKTHPTTVTNKTTTAKGKTDGKLPSAQEKSSATTSDAARKESHGNSNVSSKTKFFLEKMQDSKVDSPPSTKNTSVPSDVTKESKVRSLKSRFADKYKEKDSGVPFSKKAVLTNKSKDSKESLKTATVKENTDEKISSPQNTVPADKAEDSKVPSSLKSTSDSMDKKKDSKVSTTLKTTTTKEKTDTKSLPPENTTSSKEKTDRKPLPPENTTTTKEKTDEKSLPPENIALRDKAKDTPTSVKTPPAKGKTEGKFSSPEQTKSSKFKDWDTLLSQKSPTKDKDRKFSWSEKTKPLATPPKDIEDKKSTPPKDITTDQKSTPPKDFTTDKKSTPPKDITTDKKSTAPKDITTDKKSTPPKDITTNKKSTPPKDITTDKKSTAPKDITTNKKSTAPKDITTDKKSTPPKDITTDKKSTAPKDITTDKKSTAPKDITTDKKSTAPKDITDKKSTPPQKFVTPDSGVDVESPSSQKNSRKSSRSKSFSEDEEEEGRKRTGSTTKASDTPQQLLSVKERMAMYRQSAEHPSSEKIKVKSNRTPIMPKSAQNVMSRMERYQSEISSSGEARKSTGGDDRKTVATGTLADLRKRWESGDLLTYQEKESTSGTTTGDEMEETVVKSSTQSHKAIIRQEEAIVAQEIKAGRTKSHGYKNYDQKPRDSQGMRASSSDHDMNGVVDNGRSSPYGDEEFEQSNYESGRRSSTGDVEVVKSTTPTADDRDLVKAGTASNLKKRWESGDLQNYRERSGSSSSSSSESTHDAEEEPVSTVTSWSVEETKSAAPKPQPTPKEVPQPERREMKKSESLKKRYEEKLEKKEAKDEEREEAPRRALNRAPSFSRTMAAKFEKGAVRSRSSSSSSSSQEQDLDAEVVRATSHHHKEKPDKVDTPDNEGSSDVDEEVCEGFTTTSQFPETCLGSPSLSDIAAQLSKGGIFPFLLHSPKPKHVVNLGLSARLRSMFEKGDVHNIEAPARKSPVAIPRSTSTPDISKAGRRDSTSSSSSEEGEAHAVKTSFSDDEAEIRKAEIKGPSAKSLRAMFETSKTEDSGPTAVPKAKPKSISLFKTPPMEKCRACGKTVYAMEKIATDHDTFHKSCFKCDQCKKVLSLGTFAGIHDKLYCKPHFKQLFQSKGNYDEGFGHSQAKSKWAPKSDSPEENTQEKQQIEEVAEVKRSVPVRRPRSADLEEFDDKPSVQDDQDDEEFEARRPVPAKRQSLPKSESSSESEREEEEEVVTRRSRSSSSSSDRVAKGRSHSASSGEGSKGRSHSASSEERHTKRRSGSSSSMDEEDRRQRELSLKEGSVEEEIKRARLYRQKLLRESSQDEEDC